MVCNCKSQEHLGNYGNCAQCTPKPSFKVGDKVIRVVNPGGPARGISRELGSISTISTISPKGKWLGFRGQTIGLDKWPFYAESYVLVKEEPVKTPHKHAEIIKA
jgi:hypothetical protein